MRGPLLPVHYWPIHQRKRGMEAREAKGTKLAQIQPGQIDAGLHSNGGGRRHYTDGKKEFFLCTLCLGAGSLNRTNENTHLNRYLQSV